MATKGRRSRPSVRDALAEHPQAFDFFQAVRILEWQTQQNVADPRFRVRGPLGVDTKPIDEPVRFSAATALAFPAAPITRFDDGHGGNRTDDSGKGGKGVPRSSVAFMGLTGPSGVLPQHYSDLVLREWRDKNTSLRDFLDLFNHRLISLFYRAWRKYRLAVSFEQAFPNKLDPITTIVAALVGLGSEGVRDRLAVRDHSIFYFGGHYARRVPTAASLEAMLSDFLGLSAGLEPFHGRWIRLIEAERTRLSSPGRKANGYARLGVDAVAGEMVFNVASGFRVKVGPMAYSAFTGFLPGQQALKELVDLTRLYVGPELNFDIQCIVRHDEVPACRLGGDESDRPQLGWNTWLAHEDRQENAKDPVFASDMARTLPSAT